MGVPVNFKLGGRVETDPDKDAMGRSWHGWDWNATLDDNFSHNRGCWFLGARAQRQQYATFSVDGRIVMVAAVHGVEAVQEARGRKHAVVGFVLGDDHPIRQHFVGMSVDRHRNPVTYIDDPDGRKCACGCGGPVSDSRDFLAGHAQKAIHERIERRWGSPLEFIAWFDRTEPGEDDSSPMLYDDANIANSVFGV